MTLKVIIAGGRDFTNYELLLTAIVNANFDISEIVSGGARGADALGELAAHDLGIPVTQFLADWNSHGRAAGPIRNCAMAKYATALIAMWDGKSRGTQHMINEARKQGLLVHIEFY